MTTSTKRRARRQAPQAAVTTEATEPAKKCVLCQNTNAGELEDFGEGGDAGDYWMCVDVGPCIERAWAARPSAKDNEGRPQPETEAVATPAEDAEATT